MVTRYVVIFKDENGRVSGRILNSKEFNVERPYFPENRKDEIKKLEFCLIEKEKIEMVEEGQIWECEVVRTFIDKRNKEVKIVRPVRFIHTHSISAWKSGVFYIISGFWKREENLTFETEEKEFKDEFIHYVDKYLKTIMKCPICGETDIKIRKDREILYEAPVGDVLKFWRGYLGPEFEEVVEKRRKLEMEIYMLNNEFEKRKEKIKERISDLQYKGRVRRKLTETQKRAYIDGVWSYWERSGGDPFDEPGEAPEYVWEVVDPEAVEKAEKEIEYLKKVIESEEREHKEKIMQMRIDNIDEKVERVSLKCAELIEHRVYPCIIEKINRFDPYFFEFTRLEWMHPIEAVEYVFMACERA
jgi:hypothetical protein